MQWAWASGCSHAPAALTSSHELKLWADTMLISSGEASTSSWAGMSSAAFAAKMCMASGGEDVAAAIKHAWITSMEATSERRGFQRAMLRAGRVF